MADAVFVGHHGLPVSTAGRAVSSSPWRRAREFRWCTWEAKSSAAVLAALFSLEPVVCGPSSLPPPSQLLLYFPVSWAHVVSWARVVGPVLSVPLTPPSLSSCRRAAESAQTGRRGRDHLPQERQRAGERCLGLPAHTDCDQPLFQVSVLMVGAPAPQS